MAIAWSNLARPMAWASHNTDAQLTWHYFVKLGTTLQCMPDIHVAGARYRRWEHVYLAHDHTCNCQGGISWRLCIRPGIRYKQLERIEFPPAEEGEDVVMYVNDAWGRFVARSVGGTAAIGSNQSGEPAACHKPDVDENTLYNNGIGTTQRGADLQ